MIREPVVSGVFYPENPKILIRDIETYMKNASIEGIEGKIVGVISPHAGYMYSGQVAAYGMKALLNRHYDSVIIIGPSHRMFFEGAAIMERGRYRTPLGDVEIDENLAELLLGQDGIIKAEIKPHLGEHSLEVQIPFLQYVLKSFKLLPIVMGSQDLFTCKKLSERLSFALKEAKKECLIVGSTDLSHYYPYFKAVELDNLVLRYLKDFDIDGLSKDLQEERCEACGAGPMLTTMMVSKELGAKKSRVLKYANSGDVTGDKASVVGYVSCIFYKEENL